eukprot:c26104_g1_i1 orf=29-1393(+)
MCCGVCAVVGGGLQCLRRNPSPGSGAAHMEQAETAQMAPRNASRESGSPAKNLDSKPPPRPVFRAPQESFKANDFVYGRLLGLGSYSKVVKATKKDTGLTCALKIMDKRHIVKEDKIAFVKMERIILDQLDHPGIVRLLFTFQDAHYLYMGLECCEGGELFDQIMRKGRLSSEEARFYAAELISAMEYIHGQGLIHRDLKPENLLLTSDGHLKVGDFGSVKILKPLSNGFIQNLPDDKNCTFVGTAEYISPEVLSNRPVTIGVDLWALGCILYQLLVGKPPFKGASEYLTFQKVTARVLQFPEYLTPEAKDLINRLLDHDPNKRPGAGPDGYSILKGHPFFHGIDWGCLRDMPTPSLAPPPEETLDDESLIDDNTLDPEWELALMAGGTYMPADACNTTAGLAYPEMKGKNEQKMTDSDSNKTLLQLEESALQKLTNLDLKGAGVRPAHTEGNM